MGQVFNPNHTEGEVSGGTKAVIFFYFSGEMSSPVFLSEWEMKYLISSLHVNSNAEKFQIRGYPYTIFLISPRKHMLWVLIRSDSPRRF